MNVGLAIPPRPPVMSRVAIITRTVNRPALLDRMLRSVREQTFTDWQLVIINSGEVGAVDALLDQHGLRGSPKVLHVQYENPVPGMRGRPLNAGIHASSSDFITVLDDDDTWAPTFLEVMVGSLVRKPHPNVRGVVCRSLVIEEAPSDGELKTLREYELNPDLSNVTLASLAVVNRFCIHAFIYERSALAAAGLYPEDFPVLEDWHFNLRFLLHHDVVVVPETLTNYHLRPADTTGHQANSQTAEKPDHKYHEARLINEAMREDLRRGTPGLGQVLAQAVMTRQLADTLHRHESRLKAIGEKTGKIDTRTKQLKDKLIGKRP